MAKEENILRSDNTKVVSPGLLLDIDSIRSQSTPEKSEDENVYEVKKGDTLWGIAKKTGIHFLDLIEYNKGLGDVNKIQIGQKIKLPPMSSPDNDDDYRNIRKREAELNKSGDNEAIIKSIKHDKNFAIIDKKAKKIKVYTPDNRLIYTGNVFSGKSGDDYNTITYTDDKGGIVNYAGNNSTPAGITKISGVGTYHGHPSFIRSRYNPKTGEWDENIASSMHYRKNDGTNGCVGLPSDTANDLVNYIGKNSTVYTLPQKEGSRFMLRDGMISFVADNPYGNDKKGDKKRFWDDYNVFVDKRYKPIDIDIENSDIEPNVNKASVVDSAKDILRKLVNTGDKEVNMKAYIKGIEDSKKAIMKDMNIDSYTYNNLAEIALGIADQESKFGTSLRYYAKNALPDEAIDILKKGRNIISGNPDGKTSYRSKGITQIKLKGDNKQLRDIYDKYGIDEDALESPYNSAVATMLRLSNIYTGEVAGRKFKGKDGIEIDPTDAVLYKWSGRNRLLKSESADPSVDEYIGNVRRYANNFKLRSVGEEKEVKPEMGGGIMNNKTKTPLFATGGIVEGEDWTSEDLFNPAYSRQSHRKIDQDARDKRFTEELEQAKMDGFENVIVPAVETAIDFSPIVGDIKSAVDAVDAGKKGDYALMALAALGVFPGIPGVTKFRSMLSKAGERPIKQLAGPGYTALGEVVDAAMTPSRVSSMMDWMKAEEKLNKSRSFREMFPVLPWDAVKADKRSADAVREGINYVEDYYNNLAVKEKVAQIIKDNGKNMPPERAKILRERGIMDEAGNVDVDKYLDASPHLVGDRFSLLPSWVGGYHRPIENGGKTVTHDRNFLYRRDPSQVASNAAHEQNHKMQEVLGIDNMGVYDKDAGYYVANPDHTIGRMFSEVVNPSTKEGWYKSPQELHSFLIEYKKAKKISSDSVIDGKDFDKLLETGRMKKFFNITEENKPKIKQLINALPAIIPAAAVASRGREEYDEGGEVGEMDRYDTAFNYLVEDKGIPKKQAVAILANLVGESHLNPDTVNSIGAYGIQQWLGERKKELFRRYGEKPSLTDQLDFLVDEHKGKVKGAGWNFANKGKNLGSDRFNYYMYSRADFENAPTTADAVIAWNQGFGRPATHELRNDYRLEAGRKLAERYGVDFGSNLYGQMGIESADKYIPEWIKEPGSKAFNGYVKSGGVASYVPKRKEKETSSVVVDNKEPQESSYAKKLKERERQMLAIKEDRKRKMDFFNTVWESIKLR